MCLFVVAILPRNAEVRPLRPIIDRYEMGFAPFSSEQPLSFLIPGEQAFYATRAASTGTGCDCASDLGSFAREPTAHDGRDRRAPSSPTDKDVEKLRKKGWSAAKIDRWLAEKRGHRSKVEDQREKALARAAKGVSTPWLEFVRGIIHDGRLDYLGLLVHFFGGRPESERLAVSERATARVSELDERFFLSMVEDVVHEFHA